MTSPRTSNICCICAESRIVNCFGIHCCKQCKDSIAARPADIELLEYIDSLYITGIGYKIHQLLYRYWRDTIAIKQQTKKTVMSLSSICGDVIVQNKIIIKKMLEMQETIPYDSEPWIIVLKAWYRKNKIQCRKQKIYKNPTERLCNFMKL